MNVSAKPTVSEHIAASNVDAIISIETVRGELVARVARACITALVEFLKSDSQCLYQTLIDITAVDYPGRDTRFDVVYHFLSMELNQRIRLVAEIPEGVEMHSICGIHPSANWFEREVFDMYGVPFSGHPDLRRILTDYGFSGYPLRKDFPVTGHTEVRYDEVQKRVVSEPVRLVQEYRQFDFMSPWEGSQEIMDEIDREQTSQPDA